MMVAPAKPPTPAQIATYGHIAAALRAYLHNNHMKPGDLNERMGLKRTNTQIYQWLNAREAPAPGQAGRVSKATGIPAADLTPRAGVLLAPPPVTTKQPPIARAADVLTFGVQSDGEARLRLDVTLPYAQAVPLLRMLLDAGLVLGPATQRHDPDYAEAE